MILSTLIVIALAVAASPVNIDSFSIDGHNTDCNINYMSTTDDPRIDGPNIDCVCNDYFVLTRCFNIYN